MKVIAVSAPSANPDEVRNFAQKHYGGSVVDTYLAQLGKAYRQIGPGYHPAAAFFDAEGRPTGPPPGWPGSL